MLRERLWLGSKSGLLNFLCFLNRRNLHRSVDALTRVLALGRLRSYLWNASEPQRSPVLGVDGEQLVIALIQPIDDHVLVVGILKRFPVEVLFGEPLLVEQTSGLVLLFHLAALPLRRFFLL